MLKRNGECDTDADSIFSFDSPLSFSCGCRESHDNHCCAWIKISSEFPFFLFSFFFFCLEKCSLPQSLRSASIDFRIDQRFFPLTYPLRARYHSPRQCISLTVDKFGVCFCREYVKVFNNTTSDEEMLRRQSFSCTTYKSVQAWVSAAR